MLSNKSSLLFVLQTQTTFTLHHFQEKPLRILAEDIRDAPLQPQLQWKQSSSSKDKGVQGQEGKEEGQQGGFQELGWEEPHHAQVGPGALPSMASSCHPLLLFWMPSASPPTASPQGPKEANKSHSFPLTAIPKAPQRPSQVFRIQVQWDLRKKSIPDAIKKKKRESNSFLCQEKPKKWQSHL